MQPGNVLPSAQPLVLRPAGEEPSGETGFNSLPSLDVSSAAACRLPLEALF